MSGSHRFGRVEVRPAERALLIDGKPAELGARGFDVLLALIKHRERVVTKDELLDFAWPGLVVEENNLQVQVSTLRKLLGSQAIATIPGRGYQFSLASALSPDSSSTAAPVAATNLRRQLTSLIGRQNELAEISRLLRESRLVTLKGTGGIGKTRLSIQTGFDLLDHVPDGIWFVDLATVQDPAIVAATALSTVGHRAHAGQTTLEALIEFLCNRHALLILDNCEQVVASVAEVCTALLQACPRVLILCTSREVLNIDGEQVYAVPTLNDAEAMALFAARAKSVSADFEITDQTRALIAEVVARVDGISLAIELAAARMRAMTLGDLAKHLNDRFHLLTGGSRSALPRNQRLHAVLAWSYQLLSDEEKRLFRCLGVFNGVIDLAATTAVAGDEKWEQWQVLDLLTQLVDKSMVQTETSGSVQCYRMFESMRAFAWAEVEACGQAEALRNRHLAWFRDKAELALVANRNGDWHTQLPMLKHEYANFRAALDWSLEQEADPGGGIAICITLALFWNQFELLDEAAYWLPRAEKHLAQVSAKVQAQLLQAIGMICVNAGEAVRGKEALERSMALSAPLRDARVEWVQACNSLILLEVRRGHLEQAKVHAKRALEVCGELKLASVSTVTVTYTGYGVVCLLAGAPVEGERLLQEALKMKSHETDITKSLVLSWLADCAFTVGDVGLAIKRANDSIAQRRGLGGGPVLARTLARLAKYWLAQGDLHSAAEALNEAAPTFLRYPVYLHELFDNCTLFAVSVNQLEQAALLNGCIDAWLAANDALRPPLRQQELTPGLQKLRVALGAKVFAKTYTSGQVLTLAQGVALVQQVARESTGTPKASAAEHVAANTGAGHGRD